ncbi:MAG TPA: ROK family glucokinase [Corynebacteriales bacterium]|nr:ROK family glucokinase [Mycobacteriales bacterium]
MANTVGIDVGGTSLRAAVVDPAGRIIDRERVPTPNSAEALEDALAHVVRRLEHRNPVSAVGLAVAGFLDTDRSTVRFAPHLPWRSVNVQKRMQDRLNIPVLLEHDCNSAAWGEYVFGAAVGATNVAMIAIGTGIGGALIFNDELYRGFYGTAPEFGHLQVVPNGRPCACGKLGCFERYCSGTALVDTALELMVSNPDLPTELNRDVTPESELTGRRVVQAARAGDILALRAVDDFAHWLGTGIALVADVFDPELIVIAGGVSSSGDLFIEKARQVYRQHLTGSGYRPFAKIKQAELGDDAGQVGVARLARKLITEEA